MGKTDNKITGIKGERKAETLLENKGYEIIARNYRVQMGELDLVCRDGDILVFVEVKTKIGHETGDPEEMADKRKISQVRRVAEMYLLENHLGEVKCRIDVVAVVLGDDFSLERITHYENVY